jgi:hypothetical protein
MGQGAPLRREDQAQEEEEQVTAYRDRQLAGVYGGKGPASTTSSDVGGLTGNTGDTLSLDVTLNELREQAKARGIPYYGTKQEVLDRLKAAE